MKTSSLLMQLVVLVFLTGCASRTGSTKQDSAADGTPPEFSETLPHFQFDKATPKARSIGTLVFQVQKVGSMSADMDPGSLLILANAVVLSSDCGGFRKGEVFVAEFPEMAALLDQSILYPNQVDVGDVITITVTKIDAKHISGFWKQKKPANQALQHNDPSCHAPCVRTCRASRGRG
jgi:hypothetical protein